MLAQVKAWQGSRRSARRACEAAAVRLLVVEDDVSISGPLVEGLQREGFEVDLARTGAAALAADPVDLVLLDHRWR